MGKLAVPEYILNKPGKLTESEFEKMKLHASIGAEILSAIDFPYPVVPIVRHHHENWDGTGYPDHLKGTSIPIGARILSVVDCFDALTSDRPYRPRLADEEAINILLERRGSMYDPLVVDTFIRVHVAITPTLAQSSPASRALTEIASASNASPRKSGAPVLDEITASADEMLTLYELARGLAGQMSVGEAADVIAKHLRRLIPWSLCVFYTYDPSATELVAEHAFGDGTSLVKGLRIPLGQRLSGWVGANKQTIANSDPVLDLGDTARSHALRLRVCLSTPLLADGRLVGVLSLYAAGPGTFTDDHRRIVEVVSRQVADSFDRSREEDHASRRNLLATLPSLDQLEVRLQSRLGQEDNTRENEVVLVFVKAHGLDNIASAHGEGVSEETFCHLVDQIRRTLRVGDVVYKDGHNTVVAYLDSADYESRTAIVSRIRQSVAGYRKRLSGGKTVTIPITVTQVTAPRDGMSIAELTHAAEHLSFAGSQDVNESSIH
jgi:GGDEF domain-containing protein